MRSSPLASTRARRNCTCTGHTVRSITSAAVRLWAKWDSIGRVLACAAAICISAATATAQVLTYRTVLSSGDAAPGLPPGSTIHASPSFAASIANGGRVAIRGNVIVGGQVKIALWIGTFDSLSLQLLSGDVVAGATPGATFYNIPWQPTLNDNGQAFVDTIFHDATGHDVNALVFLWPAQGIKQVIAMDGQHPPGTPAGTVFNGVSSGLTLAMNTSGRMLFRASAGTPQTGYSSGLWWGTYDNIEKLAWRGDTNSILTYDPVAFAIRDTLQTAVFCDGRKIVRAEPGSQFITVVSTTTAQSLNYADICNREDAVMTLLTTSSSANFVMAGHSPFDVPSPVLQGQIFTFLPNTPVYCDNHSAMFSRSPQTGQSATTLFYGDPYLFEQWAPLHPIAVRGDPVPDAPAGVTYGNAAAPTTNPFDYYWLNRLGAYAFGSIVSGLPVTNYLYVMEDIAGQPHAAGVPGTVVEVRPGVFKTIYYTPQLVSSSGGSDGRMRIWNDSSQLAIRPVFTDNTTAVLIAQFCATGPTVTTNPSSVCQPLGSTVTFSAAGAGVGNLSYEWNRLDRVGNTTVATAISDSARINGVRTPTLTIQGLQSGDTGNIGINCRIWNSCASAFTSPATVTIDSGPTITQQPSDADACASGSATFFVGASNPETTVYQWQHQTPAAAWVNVNNGSLAWSGGTITADGAATSQVLLTLNVAPGSSPLHVRCVTASACASVTTDSATLTFNGPCCDPIDFNSDTLFPDTLDIDDFLSVFSGGVCDGQSPGDPPCNTDIDFNNDTLFPDTDDINALLRVFSGGACT